MIINIRGTSGSGKSTLVRNIMERYDRRIAFKIEGRKQPIGYLLSRENGRSLAVLGHYETDCGGCDTINKMEEIFRLVRENHDRGMDVLFEGLLISADFNRTHALHADGYPLVVVGLDVPLDVCLESVNGRRMAKWERRCEKATRDGKPLPDKPKPLNPKNTESKWKGTKSTMKKLREHGVDARWGGRDDAESIIVEELKL